MQVRLLSHMGFEAHLLIPFHRHGENGGICVGEFATRLCQLSTVQHQFSEHVETTASSELTCSCSYIHETRRAYSIFHQFSIFTLYSINCTDFQSTTVLTTRLRHWRMKYGQWRVQHTYFHQSVTMFQPEIYGLHRNICSTCL